MFDLAHLLIILPSLFLLVLAIYRWEGTMMIWLGARIEYPYITKLMPFQIFPQNPYIATSSRAPSSVMAERWDKDSPESGCKWGSVVTPWQTSVNSVAVISLTSLCLTAGKPPVLQVRACSTLNGCPQLQWDGEFWSGQPYLSERLSLQAALCRANPCSSMGSAVSQVDAPFSWESSMERWRGIGRFRWRLLASSFCFVRQYCY